MVIMAQELILTLLFSLLFWGHGARCRADALESVMLAYQNYDNASHEETTPTLIGLKLHDEIARGNLTAAETLLKTDMKDNKFPEINHWLLAKLALHQKKYSLFQKHLLNAKKLPLLKNTKLARELYDAVPSAKRSWLVQRIIDAGYFETPDESACPYFELQKRRERAEFLYLISKNHKLNEKIKNRVLRELYVLMPEAIEVDKLRALNGFMHYANSLPANDAIKRMEQLLIFGKNNEARATFLERTGQKKNKLSKAERCELDYVDAKIDRKLRKFDAARGRFKTLSMTCPQETELKARFLDLMLASQRGDESSLPDYAAFVERFPHHSFTDDVLLFKANLLLDKKQFAEALATLKQIIEHYPQGDMIDRARFLLGYELAKVGKHDEALATFQSLLEATSPSALEHSQAQYWIARLQIYRDLYVMENPNKDNIASAKASLNDLVNLTSPNVYSWLAYGLLTHLGDGVVVKGEQREAEAVLNIARDLSSIENLVLRGFRREALALLDDIAVNKTVHGFGASMAKLYDALDQPSAGHQKLIRCDFETAQVLKRDVPNIYRKISYPRPFKKEVSFAVTRVDIPEEIIFAIMRQESGFIPESLSWAGARGLMQLMYPSALAQAGTWGIKNLEEDDLYTPNINVLLASSLLQGYWQQFGSVIVGLAAYNAGPNMAKAWLGKIKGGLLDTFVEEISYKETRDYVKSVLGNIYTYITFGEDKTSIAPSFKHIASIK